MAKQCRGKRASENQKEYLVDFLQTNVDIANDTFLTADGAKFRDEKWRELSVDLNALGGTQKDGGKWKKYWSDLRVHTKAKHSAIRQDEQRSGVNDLRKATSLSALEKKIIQIITIEAVDGDNTREVGFAESTVVEFGFDNAASFACDTTEIAANSMQAIATLGTTTAVATTSNATAQTTATSGSFSTAATSGASARAATSGASTAAAKRVKRSQKRRAQESTDHVGNLFNIEEKKLKAMEVANDLKREQLQLMREQLQLMREQMADTKTDIELKRDLCCKLQEIIEVFKVHY